jgi:hypothetical protein
MQAGNRSQQAVDRYEHDSNRDSKRVVLTDPFGGLVTSGGNYALRVDDTTTANVTYIGVAQIGTATSTASWQIKKIDQSSGTAMTWADADDEYDNVWDNRASLSYS